MPHLTLVATAALWLWFGGWAIALSAVDLRRHRLPNRMVAITFAGCVLLTLLLALAAGDPGIAVRALAASGVASIVFLGAHVLGGMGMGDVKYAAVTGWVLGTIGWSAVWWGHLLGFVAAGIVVVVGVLISRMHRGTEVPFGPFMGLGTVVVGVWAVTPAMA